MEFLVTVTPASTSFVDRHIGARRQADVDAMLKAVGYDTVDETGSAAGRTTIDRLAAMVEL